MAVPLDGIRAIHNAFRKEMTAIDVAAYAAARGRGGLDVVERRCALLNEILVWHAEGEEEFVFPALEAVAPLVAEPYERDHRGLDSLAGSLDIAIRSSDSLAAARVTAAFDFHLGLHLNKEDVHLYRIFGERVSLADQGAILGRMSGKIPQERFPEVVSWLFPLLEIDDRENMVRIWRQALPEAVFARVTGLIRSAVGDGWAELAGRVPEIG